MTLGVESRSQSQEPRCPRILPCRSLSRPLPAMMRAWLPGSRPGRARGRTGWLAGLRRERLPESLLADGTIAAAAAAEHAHKQERALNAEVTALCLVTGALFPVLGYDPV